MNIRMRSIIIVSILIFSFLSTVAQKKMSNGHQIPVRGEIRVLLIFAEVDYSADNCPDRLGEPEITKTNNWGVDEHGVTQIPAGADSLFDHKSSGRKFPQGYITDLYYQASLGKYILLGDYYPEVVVVPCSTLARGPGAHANAVIQELNKIADTTVCTKNGYMLKDFDLWDWDPFQTGTPKMQGQDHKIDIFYIVWRNNHYMGRRKMGPYGCNGGFGLVGCRTKGLKDMTGGVSCASSFNSCSNSQGCIQITLAEFMHGPFGGNHWHSARGRGVHTFMAVPHSYSITGQSHSTMQFVCGWDRWILEWEHEDKNQDDSIYISVGNTKLGETPSDISIESHPNGATFILRDFVRTGDAVRIKLPYLEAPVKNQYIWLENRRMDTRYDKYYQEECADNADGKYRFGTPGIYAYIQVGKDVKEGNNIYSASPKHPNGLASWLFPLSGEGNYDFRYRYDLIQEPLGSWYCGNWNNKNIPIDKSRSIPNPFTGHSDLYQVINSDSSDKIYDNDRLQSGLSEVVYDGKCNNELEEGSVCHNYNRSGDFEDAYCFANGTYELSLNTNPAAVPVYTLRADYNGKR
ncbi:MAG: hypothetical protein IIA45_06285, partial [Bacteroidetes bacterium]|nr:hypothetical protein [Bacteroidota bacterium]